MSFTAVTPACSNNSLFDLFHMPCGTDASVGILHSIFGDVISNLVSGVPAYNHATLIPEFLQNFNTALMSGALLLFAIIVIVGTINTGHHGKFLGQQ